MTALFLYRNEMKSICDEIGSPQRYHDEKKPSATPQQEVFPPANFKFLPRIRGLVYGLLVLENGAVENLRKMALRNS